MLMDLCVVLRMHPNFRQFKVALAFTLYKAPSCSLWSPLHVYANSRSARDRWKDYQVPL